MGGLEGFRGMVKVGGPVLREYTLKVLEGEDEGLGIRLRVPSLGNKGSIGVI